LCTGTASGGLKQGVDLKTLMLSCYVNPTVYIPPSEGQLSQAQALFEKLLTNRTFTDEDRDAWASIGLLVQYATDATGRPYAAISERGSPSDGKGHGFYAVKLGHVSTSESSKFLQGPHRPADLYTHEIVFDLLTEFNVFGAAGWSSTHRDVVDLCKETSSFYNSFTKALAKHSVEGNATTTPTLLQVHGFSKEGQNVDVDVVFSSTKMEMPSGFLPISSCLKNALGPSSWKVLNYPDEVDFLGGTLNINAQLFYATNPNGKFIHYENSRELRDELRVNRQLQGSVAGCF